MGTITITMNGSFGGYRSKTVSAMQKGHAAAVAEAIDYLATEELPKAIKNDHECHSAGLEPEAGFGGLGRLGVTKVDPRG